MRYRPELATISEDEFNELMAIVRAPPDQEQPMTEEGRSRARYREEQARKRIAAQQHDLFGGPTITHYRRHAPKAQVDLPPVETIEAKMERIKGDRTATFGPARADRAAYLTLEERDAIMRSAENWLRVGQRIRIVDGAGAVDPKYGPSRFIGREGVVWRRCSAVFADRVYVFLDPVGAERAAKIEFVELRDVEPIE